MVDNNLKQDKNQQGGPIFDFKSKPAENSEKPTPIFETVSAEEADQSPTQESPQPTGEQIDLKPEEIPSDVLTPEEALTSGPSSGSSDVPPPHSDDKIKYLIVGGGIIFFLLIFFLFIKLLSGGTAVKKEITLNYWSLWDDKAVIQPLIEQYQAKSPNVKIIYEKKDPREYREKLIARSRNGQGPDIFRFHNTWLPQISEITSPIPQNIMSNSEFEKTFYPIHAKDLKSGNYYFGIPLEIDGLVLVYNDNMFKKAGITKAPSSWEDITDYVEKLSVKDSSGQIINSPIAIGTASNVEHFSDIFGLMLLQNGADLKQLDSPEAAGALESYRKLAEAPTDFWNDSMPNSVVAFAQEKVAMIIVPSWEILTVKAINPDIKLKAVATPRLPGASPVSYATYWVEGVSKLSKNQLESWKFLRFLVERENMTKLYAEQSKTRLFGSPYSRVDLGPTIVQNEYIGAVIQQADSYVSLPLSSRTHDKGLNDDIIQYLENAINSSIQGVSYNEALRVASQGVSQVYTRYKIE